VWKADQIRALFDSLVRGHPIGAFLFWKVGAERAAQLRRARCLGSPSGPVETLRPGATRRTLGVVTDHGGGHDRRPAHRRPACERRGRASTR
jgi:hypothetical protein